ncbi:uncharacterized protein LOC142765386 [Rhipicephalus microplus]|uniref:uncharacterized protein LOC142765386 n=1 Tax=Rhipicephalus microplus TaxID=6941 RepID=UPI003F6C4187
MQMITGKGFSVFVMAMLLASDATNGDGNQQQQGATAEEGAGSEQANREQENTVDIVQFYGDNGVIWIFGLGNSQYPCLVDIVETTNNKSTFFERYYKKKSSQLKGMFRNVDRTDANFYNAMLVSRRDDGGRRRINSRRKSWNGLEVMLRENSERNCALFEMKYSESPNHPPVRGASTKTMAEYNLRVKNAIVKSPEAEAKVKTCFENLESWYKSQPQHEQLQQPLFTQCKKECERNRKCANAISSQRTEGSPGRA